MPRYEDQPEYQRPRDAVRRNDGRDVRRAVEPQQRRPVLDRDFHVDDAMDTRMDTRQEPRAANVGTRMEKPVRVDPRADREVLYRDSRTGEIFRDAPARRTPYENDFEDMQPNTRPIVVTPPEPGQPPRVSYAEYFLPGEGIEREVIQAEICRYLGQDATCRPGKNPQDQRSGFIIKAYRALTTEMIRSLQESSAKFRNDERYWADKEKQRRRPEGNTNDTVISRAMPDKSFAVTYTPIQDNQYDREMDMDDEPRAYMQTDRYNREMDPRDPRDPRDPHNARDPRDLRAQMPARHMPPVSSTYLPEPAYPAYAIGPSQPSIPPIAFEPRAFQTGGNTTPPTGMRGTTFAPPPPPSDFPVRPTQQSQPAMSAQAYMDPRTGKMVGSYPSYSTDTRHRR